LNYYVTGQPFFIRHLSTSVFEQAVSLQHLTTV